MSGLDAELRRAADEFVLVVAVVADENGAQPYEVAREAISDALARLTEVGALGETEKEES